jgi:hypothetical protein
VAGRKNPASTRRSEPRTEKARDKKRGRGMDEMGMGMLKWISCQFDNFAGVGLELELTVGTVQYSALHATRSRYHLMLRTVRRGQTRQGNPAVEKGVGRKNYSIIASQGGGWETLEKIQWTWTAPREESDDRTGSHETCDRHVWYYMNHPCTSIFCG